MVRVAIGGIKGRMGNLLEELISEELDMDVVYGIDPKIKSPVREDGIVFLPNVETLKKTLKEGPSFTLGPIENIDVYVDFTEPGAVISNLADISELGIDSVVGTTGWSGQLPEAEKIANEFDRRIVYAPNFSIGVNAFLSGVKEIANVLGKYGYDSQIMELHHTGKKDAPSGTAILAGEILKKYIPGKNKLSFERRTKRNDEEIDVLGGRVGKVAGYHQIIFTPNKAYDDKIVLIHDANNPKIFCRGAKEAIRWLYNNKDLAPGLYPFSEHVLGLNLT